MHRTFTPRRKAFLALVAAPLLAACSASGIDVDDAEYVIEVSAIEAPEGYVEGQPLQVRFRGTVGPDGCHSLDRVERERTPSTVRLRFIGVRVQGAVACTLAIVELDEMLVFEPPFADPFTIRVTQPDGQTLERAIPGRGG